MKIFNLGAPSKNVEDRRSPQGDAANVMFKKQKARWDKIVEYEKGGKPLPGPMPPNMAKPRERRIFPKIGREK